MFTLSWFMWVVVPTIVFSAAILGWPIIVIYLKQAADEKAAAKAKTAVDDAQKAFDAKREFQEAFSAWRPGYDYHKVMRAKALETGGTPSHFNDSGSKSKARRIPTEIIGYPGDTVNLHDRNVSPCIMYPVPLADSINASVGVTIPVQKLRVGANGDITMVRNDESITTPAQAPNGQVDVSHILTSEKDVIRYAANHKDPRDV